MNDNECCRICDIIKVSCIDCIFGHIEDDCPEFYKDDYDRFIDQFNKLDDKLNGTK